MGFQINCACKLHYDVTTQRNLFLLKNSCTFISRQVLYKKKPIRNPVHSRIRFGIKDGQHLSLLTSLDFEGSVPKIRTLVCSSIISVVSHWKQCVVTKKC